MSKKTKVSKESNRKELSRLRDQITMLCTELKKENEKNIKINKILQRFKNYQSVLNNIDKDFIEYIDDGLIPDDLMGKIKYKTKHDCWKIIKDGRNTDIETNEKLGNLIESYISRKSEVISNNKNRKKICEEIEKKYGIDVLMKDHQSLNQIINSFDAPADEEAFNSLDVFEVRQLYNDIIKEYRKKVSISCSIKIIKEELKDNPLIKIHNSVCETVSGFPRASGISCILTALIPVLIIWIMYCVKESLEYIGDKILIDIVIFFTAYVMFCLLMLYCVIHFYNYSSDSKYAVMYTFSSWLLTVLVFPAKCFFGITDSLTSNAKKPFYVIIHSLIILEVDLFLWIVIAVFIKSLKPMPNYEYLSLLVIITAAIFIIMIINFFIFKGMQIYERTKAETDKNCFCEWYSIDDRIQDIKRIKTTLKKIYIILMVIMFIAVNYLEEGNESPETVDNEINLFISNTITLITLVYFIIDRNQAIN